MPSAQANNSGKKNSEEDSALGKRVRNPSFKKAQSMIQGESLSQQIGGTSLGLKSKREAKQGAHKDGMIQQQLGRAMSQSSQQKLPLMSKRTS